jgi:hypothetical protein
VFRRKERQVCSNTLNHRLLRVKIPEENINVTATETAEAERLYFRSFFSSTKRIMNTK